MPVLGRFANGLMSRRAERIVAERQSAVLGADTFHASTLGATAPHLCAAQKCIGGWVPAWKKKRRPIFESEWGCSSGCLQTMVRAAVRRESSDVGQDDGMQGSHRHRVPLGLVLLAQGWITHPQLQTALAAQRLEGGRKIGEWLEKSCGLPNERVMRGLGVQWGCPVLSSDSFHPSAMALVMPRRFVVEFGMLPVRIAGSRLLYVAFEGGPDAAASLALEQMSGLKVESGLIAGADFEAMRRALLEQPGVATTVATVNDADVLTNSIAKTLEQHQPVASRLVRIRGYYWLRLWLETGSLGGRGMLPPSTEDVMDYVFSVGPNK